MFENLSAGDSLSISYTRAWNISSPAEGEFPPSYGLYINYDPDIYLDSNLENDDNDLSNNSHTESGIQINDMF